MEEKFDVTGMTCAACQANVTRVVSKLDGVSHCDVSLLSNSMKVEFDQDKVNEQMICEAVKQIGYGASVHGQKTEVRKEWQDRHFIGFEIEPRYFWIIHNRLCEEVRHHAPCLL